MKDVVTKVVQKLVTWLVGSLYVYIYSNNKKLYEKNKDLLNMYEGNRIFIFYSGISIRDINFSAFRYEYVMGVNLLALHHEFRKLDADFYCYTGSWDASLSKLCAWGLHTVYTSINNKVILFLNSSSYYWINYASYYGIRDYRNEFKDRTYFIGKKAFYFRWWK